MSFLALGVSAFSYAEIKRTADATVVAAKAARDAADSQRSMELSIHQARIAVDPPVNHQYERWRERGTCRITYFFRNEGASTAYVRGVYLTHPAGEMRLKEVPMMLPPGIPQPFSFELPEDQFDAALRDGMVTIEYVDGLGMATAKFDLRRDETGFAADPA
jgi:hypothetical protein